MHFPKDYKKDWSKYYAYVYQNHEFYLFNESILAVGVAIE